MSNYIPVNIWDDYHDDGYVPEGEIQETYAYVESKLEDEECKNVLILLKEKIEHLTSENSGLTMSINYYDSAKVYPNLVGTEYEYSLYKRWQLEMKNLTHETRESLVEALKKEVLEHKGIKIKVYSES